MDNHTFLAYMIKAQMEPTSSNYIINIPPPSYKKYCILYKSLQPQETPLRPVLDLNSETIKLTQPTIQQARQQKELILQQPTQQQPAQQQPTQQQPTQQQTPSKCCKTSCKTSCNSYKCYNIETSQDMRCCGLCYYQCYQPNTPTEDKSEYCCCPATFEDYVCKSEMVLTTMPYKHIDINGDECDETCYATICWLPCKLPLFIPCCMGSVINNIINLMRGTHMNYLC